MLPTLSLFFPCYNEEHSIESLLKEALIVASRLAELFEIIVIDDGSTDKTSLKVLEISKLHPQVRLISSESNAGYGAALRRGFAECRYEWIFFSDGDQQFMLAELKLLVEKSNQADFIIGFRQNRADGQIRKIMQALLRQWVILLLDFPSAIIDINCAFKLMHREKLLKCLPLDCSGAMISTELLLNAWRRNISILQIPVSHLPRKAGVSGGNSYRVIVQAVKETWILRRRQSGTVGAKNDL